MPDCYCPHHEFHFWDAQYSSMGDHICKLTAQPEYAFGAKTGGTEYLACDQDDFWKCPLHRAYLNAKTPVDEIFQSALRARRAQMDLPGLERRMKSDLPLAGLRELEAKCASIVDLPRK